MISQILEDVLVRDSVPGVEPVLPAADEAGGE